MIAEKKPLKWQLKVREVLFLGFYGLVGQDHHVVVISDFEDATDYMSVVGKVMMGGATSDIKTVTCYTGAEAKIAMAKATGNDINYTPPS